MKKVMVYGNGVSGKGAKKLLEHLGEEVILVDDKTAISSSEALKHLDDTKLFIKSPGIPYTKLVNEAKVKGIKIIDEIELAYNYIVDKSLPVKIIAITGTNGKSTTTAKISDMLNFAGYKATFAGNIGVSLAETILNNPTLDYIALELSSFQLENIENFKPYISMIINMGPDHIERYKSFDEYYDTKFNIQKEQDGNCYFIENIDDVEIEKRKSWIKTNKVTISKFNLADVYIKDEKIFFKDEYITDRENLSLKGIHNLENVLFMIATAKIIGIDNTKIKDFLSVATPLEHRTEEFFNYGKIKFINDSKATNVDSTRFALETNKNCILICGGYDKGVDLKPLAQLIKENNIKETYLIGVIAEKIKTLLLEIGYDEKKIFMLDNLEKTLLFLKEKLDKNIEDVVLLSPATSSYDQFNSFEHRGKVFKELVLKIFG
ncbi:MAG: UDP-N-acetylmuramoyl-L-alanine--D-glutamate ligase [Fusobacterium gastrosuis]|uniref:UDP-N-acetylmuramoyl-L-alanine--D-glutamate ligase n=1 Tax=Fusobacterium gastrosuis TaxID=1755100 RepID=UPI002A9FF89E|nr:UDP-N-acetylmuramoyl-L-alanine--D-glutamate ligase [Fusobacterium gastrosuis]